METKKRSRSKKKKSPDFIKGVEDLLNSKTSLYFLFLSSLLGFVFSVYIHIRAYLGESSNYLWFFFWGMFVIWLPVISIIKRISIEKRRTFIEYLKKYTPSWIRVLFIVLSIYCSIVFFFYIFRLTGLAAPHELLDRNIMNRLEIFLGELTKGEIQNTNFYETRSFSSMWIIVYYSAMVITLSKIRARTMKRKARTLKAGESPNRTPKLEVE